jgi:hypothetical protein
MDFVRKGWRLNDNTRPQASTSASSLGCPQQPLAHRLSQPLVHAHNDRPPFKPFWTSYGHWPLLPLLLPPPSLNPYPIAEVGC